MSDTAEKAGGTLAGGAALGGIAMHCAGGGSYAALASLGLGSAAAGVAVAAAAPVVAFAVGYGIVKGIKRLVSDDKESSK